MRALVLLITALWAGAAAAEDLRIGYLSLADDTRYQQDWGYARLILPPPVRTVEAARMAITDLAFVAEAVNLKPVLDARRSGPDGLAASVQAMVADGAGFVVLDLPAPMVKVVAEAVAGLPVTLINATAPEIRPHGLLSQHAACRALAADDDGQLCAIPARHELDEGSGSGRRRPV